MANSHTDQRQAFLIMVTPASTSAQKRHRALYNRLPAEQMAVARVVTEH
jgi:hypothetical protein